MTETYYEITQPVRISVDLSDMVSDIQRQIVDLILTAITKQVSDVKEKSEPKPTDENCFDYHVEYICNSVIKTISGSLEEPPESDETRSVEELDINAIIHYVKTHLKLNNQALANSIKLSIKENPWDADYQNLS